MALIIEAIHRTFFPRIQELRQRRAESNLVQTVQRWKQESTSVVSQYLSETWKNLGAVERDRVDFAVVQNAMIQLLTLRRIDTSDLGYITIKDKDVIRLLKHKKPKQVASL